MDTVRVILIEPSVKKVAAIDLKTTRFVSSAGSGEMPDLYEAASIVSGNASIGDLVSHKIGNGYSVWCAECSLSASKRASFLLKGFHKIYGPAIISFTDPKTGSVRDVEDAELIAQHIAFDNG